MMMMMRSRSRLLLVQHRKEELVVTWQRLFNRNYHCSNDSSRPSPMAYNGFGDNAAKEEEAAAAAASVPSTWQWNTFKMEKETAQFKTGLEVFQKRREQHPQDIENLKKYADYIITMVPKCIPPNTNEALTYRLEAKDILDAVLEKDMKDYQSWFNLGKLCDDILECSCYLDISGCTEASVLPFNDNYLQIHEKAIYCFKRVNDEAPPGQFDSERRLNRMLRSLPDEKTRRILNGEMKEDEIEEDEMEEDEMEEDEMLEDETEIGVAMARCRIEKALSYAEKESKINPNNADNTRTWGTALVGLAFHSNRLTEKRALISDAMKKFRKASKLKPGDKKTKLELVRARLLITGRSVEEFEGPGSLVRLDKALSGIGKVLTFFPTEIMVGDEMNKKGKKIAKSFFVRIFGSMRQFTEQVWDTEGEMEEDEMEKLDVTAIYKFEESAYSAAKESTIVPNNADNLSRLGTALVGLAFYSKHRAERWELISDAMINFRKALKLNPEDEKTKLELARARFLITGRDSEGLGSPPDYKAAAFSKEKSDKPFSWEKLLA